MFKLFVGNLSFHTSEARLREVFAQFGEVSQVFLGKDRQTGRPRGFGFVSMGTKDAGQLAIAGLDGKPLDGRMIVVTAAEKRDQEGSRGGEGASNSRGGKRSRNTAVPEEPPLPPMPPTGWDGHHDGSRRWDHGRSRDEAHDRRREGRFDRET